MSSSIIDFNQTPDCPVPRFILRINSERSEFYKYARVAWRLLLDEKAPEIQLKAFGAVNMLNLNKVSNVLSEMFGGLHKLTYISYRLCYKCLNG